MKDKNKLTKQSIMLFIFLVSFLIAVSSLFIENRDERINAGICSFLMIVIGIILIEIDRMYKS